MRLASLAFLIALSLAAQTFEDRPALQLSNDRITLLVMPQGGSLASLVLNDDSSHLSPLWNPIRYRFGSGSGPNYSMGHFTCVDGFGPVSGEERKAGMEGHGEAHRLPWETKHSGRKSGVSELSQTVRLPLVNERFTRTLKLVDGENVIYSESTLANELAFDRPIVWAEHATIGTPFLEPVVTVVDVGGSRSQTRNYEGKPNAQMRRLAPKVDFTWPSAPLRDGGTVDLRAAPANPRSMDHTTTLMDPSREWVWVTAIHTGKHMLFGYLFRREEFPWLQIWENYVEGRMARGLEFSTQPYDVPRRESIGMGTMFGAPTYRWLPAKSEIHSKYLMFYTRVPEDFSKVDDVQYRDGKLVIEDRKAGKTVTLAASLGL